MSIISGGDEPRKPRANRDTQLPNSGELNTASCESSDFEESEAGADPSYELIDQEGFEDDYGPDEESPKNVIGDDEDVEDDAYLDPWDAGVEPDAKGVVEQWKIVAVGRRPEDFLARDCLYGSLLQDRSEKWFQRYLKRPARWMEELVLHLPKGPARRQALQCVVLDFLHKKHLARLYPVVLHQYGDDSDETARLRRLWRCTPYTVQVARRNGARKNVRGCGYPRLCPWCFARKVLALYDLIRRGPLREAAGKFLLLGKARPFTEPYGGIDGSWARADELAHMSNEAVRGHRGRYFGLNPGRTAETRSALAATVREAASALGAVNGLVTHQLGSAQLPSGHRTFLHDLGLIAEVPTRQVLDLKRMAGEGFVWETREPLKSGRDLALSVQWVSLPADRPGSLRFALAGGSIGTLWKRFGLSEPPVQPQGADSDMMRGALSWQPNLLLDDQMWFAYAQAVKNQQLYHPFGTWKESMALAAAVVRSSIDRRFRDAQAERFEQDRQQKGNRQRSREARDRRAELFKVALEVWPQVLTERTTRPGRPGRRKRLAELLHQRGLRPSRRDLEWLMNQLGSRGDMPSG